MAGIDDPEQERYFVGQLQWAGTIIMDRTSYEMMAPFWPTSEVLPAVTGRGAALFPNSTPHARCACCRPGPSRPACWNCGTPRWRRSRPNRPGWRLQIWGDDAAPVPVLVTPPSRRRTAAELADTDTGRAAALIAADARRVQGADGPPARDHRRVPGTPDGGFARSYWTPDGDVAEIARGRR